MTASTLDSKPNRGMWDLRGWHQITCEESDALRSSTGTGTFSTLTDPDGEFGAPLIYTEWGVNEPDRAVLREYRWPDDANRDCEHWVPDAGEEAR